MKITLLLTFLLYGCTSFRELSARETVKGNYLFNLKLKTEYSRFLADSGLTTKNLYAGPAFVEFLNGQSIQLVQVSPKDASNSVYRSQSNSEIEYLGHRLTALSKNAYRLEFDAVFKGLTKKVTYPLNLELKVSCKKSIHCRMDPDYDFFLHSSPYIFSFSFSPRDRDFFTSKEPRFEKHSPREQTAVIHRMIFIGMREEAAREAIGNFTHHIHGFHNVRFKEGHVDDYEFKFDHNLHYFNR